MQAAQAMDNFGELLIWSINIFPSSILFSRSMLALI